MSQYTDKVDNDIYTVLHVASMKESALYADLQLR